jgi:hypothetical protein
MEHNSKRKTTVTAGSGYESKKKTEIYTPDTAPINYQEVNNSIFSEIIDNTKKEEDTPVITNKETNNVPHIVLDEVLPKKELLIEKSFLDSFSKVYISGQYPIKGNTDLRIKEIIKLLVQNTGAYHIRVNPSIKNTIIDMIQYGKDSLLGRSISQYERNVIISLFKNDNVN